MSENKLQILMEELKYYKNNPRSDPLEEKQRLCSIKNVQRMCLCEANAQTKNLVEKLESIVREMAIQTSAARIARNTIVFAVQTVIGDSAMTELGNSFSEKQDQAVTRTEVVDNGVVRESGADRHVPEELMRESAMTELRNSLSEKQDQAVMRTEVIDNGVVRESTAKRHVPEEPMRESAMTELRNSLSEKQDQAVMRTEVVDSGVVRESRAERHVPEEEDWASEDSHSSFLILCFAWR